MQILMKFVQFFDMLMIYQDITLIQLFQGHTHGAIYLHFLFNKVAPGNFFAIYKILFNGATKSTTFLTIQFFSHIISF